MHAFPCFPASQTVLFFLENYFKDKNLYPGFGDLVFVVLVCVFFPAPPHCLQSSFSLPVASHFTLLGKY